MRPARHVAWLGLGSNLDAPAEQIARAIHALERAPELCLLAASSRYRTVPVGGPPGQPAFCNACVAVGVDGSPLQLLAITQAIEQAQGRVRDVRWGPRTLDIDILAFDDLRCCDPRLMLPHPRAGERAFVLVPLAEIAPALMLGRDGRAIDLLRCVDPAGVERWPGE